MADNTAILLPEIRPVVAPVLKEFLLDERAVLVVLEVLGDGVEGVLEEAGVLRIVRRDIQIDQIGGCMIADRVPVLLGAVMLQRGCTRIQSDRVDVGEVSALLTIEVEPVEQLDRQISIREDARVAIDAVRLDRARQRIDLLVGGNGVVVIAELRGQQLLLLISIHLHAMIPVDQFFFGIVEAHVIAQILRALLRGLEEGILTRHQEC